MLNSWKPDPANTPSRDEMDAAPVARPEPARSTSIAGGNKKSQSIVDECLTMRGDLESEADILVKGKVIGNINCHVLIVDRNAIVEGGVEAKEVVVRGRVKGVIKADRVRLDGTADVECDIYQLTFSAEEGARIRGSLKNMDELPKSDRNAAPAKTAAPKKDVAADEPELETAS